MKLESTLPDRPGFLHAVPVFDLFALLLLFILLGPSFIHQSGVRVDMPLSRYQIERDPNAAVITITQGVPPVLWLEREQVSREELIRRLAARREGSTGSLSVYVRSDGKIPADFERQVAETALQQGYRVYLLGRAFKAEDFE